MPNWFPSYTNCTPPSGWTGPPINLAVGLGVFGVIAGGTLATILSASASGAAAIAGLVAVGASVFLAAACWAGIQYCDWWLNTRLICLGGDQSAVGVIYKPSIEPPKSSYSSPSPFVLDDYDTDYSFNLLLWPFVPRDALPQEVVDTAKFGTTWGDAITQLESVWPPSTVANHSYKWSDVSAQVNLVLPQAIMANLQLGFTGQYTKGTSSDEPPSPQPDPLEQFSLHSEIEGAGVRDLRTLLYVLLAAFLAATAVYFIPVTGPILSVILAILSFLAALFGGSASEHDSASPPTGWGGPINPYDSGNPPGALVDILYVYGRWVYDSQHQPSGWNELHPLHFITVIAQATQGDLGNGIWPPNIQGLIANYNQQYGIINAPGTTQIQAQPQNQWTLHPVLDGCLGQTPYPIPPPPQTTQ